MANPEHVKIVKQGAEAIQKWRDGNPGERLDLEEADLSGADLKWANLAATFEFVPLYQFAPISEADLNGARLSRANLSRANLSGARLKSADLSGANLSRARLSEANLNGANLNSANLVQATLRAANLSGASLDESDISGANLKSADLSGASLCRAKLGETNLYGANLNRAYLKGADFVSAICSATIFGNVDLSKVSGLKTIRHDGPSIVGIETYYKSKGHIPEVFLRGAGVPDNLIKYLGSLTGTAFDFYSCFISYTHADKAFARRLHDALQGRGIRCWLDEKQIMPGDDIYEKVEEGLKFWDKILLCASSESLESWWVGREIDRAFKKEMDLKKERGESVLAIIPLDLDGHFLKWDHQHAAELQKRLAADFVGWETDNAKFESELENVVTALKSNDPDREPPPIPKL